MHERWHRAVDARDPRFDGVFYVGIVTTRIYCRPVCPSRRANPENRRFFPSVSEAEDAGFRACLRCRPDVAPGRAECDALARLARTATHRIGAGALDGRSVRALAEELSVSERHLRRALDREVGASPVKLAQEHRLRLARRLLVETALSVTSVAYAAGFQSLRRFNALFRRRHGMSPSSLRRHASRGVAIVVAAIALALAPTNVIRAQARVCTTPAHRQFDFFLGDWDTFDAGAPAKVIARNHVTRMLDGCAVREVYEQRDGLVGESFSAFDATRGEWHQSWVTNRGQLLLLDGRIEGGRMVLTGSERDSTGTTVLVRGTWWHDADAVRERAERSRDGGMTWMRWFDLVFRPHKPLR